MSPRAFKCLLFLMIRPIHSSTHVSLSSICTNFLDVSSLHNALPAVSGCICSCGSTTGRGDSPTREGLWTAPSSLTIWLNKALNEPQRSALHAVAALSKINTGVNPKFNFLVEDIKRNQPGVMSSRSLSVSEELVSKAKRCRTRELDLSCTIESSRIPSYL